MHAAPKAERALQSRIASVNKKLSPQNRILRGEGFDGALKGRRFASPAFNAFMQPNDSGQAKLGIVVSKRNFPLASRRNQIKRIAREAFRCHSIKKQAVDVVLVARRQGIPKRADIEVLLSRVESACETF